jgi:CBS domain-containing protein
MKVRDILPQKGRNVVTIEVDKTVHDAICKLNEHGIGALVVTGEGNEICGIVTERDILRECGQRCTRLEERTEHGHSACPALVKDVMTKDLIISVPDDDLDYVMRVMTRNHIRHLPILEGGELAGIISIGDVVNANVEAADFENRMLKDYVEGRTY